MDSLLYSIIALLPRNSEEGSDASSVSRGEMQKLLVEQHGANQTPAIQTTLDMLENLFTKISLLDPNEVQAGRWKFVSFPARLCGLSVLHTLADPRQQLLPAGFWHTAGVSQDVVTAQKAVLEAIENRRYDSHLPGSTAQPIRFIYVAWALIMMNGKILFHRREAKEHADEYGLVGGRANLQDLRRLMGEDTPIVELLQELQAPSSQPMFRALPFTLERELEEEVNLASEYYHIEEWSHLEPFTKCMGAAPNYALTQYFFCIYHVKLTTPGYLALRNTLRKRDPDLIECSIPEVAAGRTDDGAKALALSALYNAYSDDRTALRGALERLPPSYHNEYTFTQDKDGIIFSMKDNLRTGASGREKNLDAALTFPEKALLVGLAGHGKGLPCVPHAAVTLHEFGWVEVRDEQLRRELKRLSEHLRSSFDPIIEVLDSLYFRLALAPELIYFDPTFFAWSFDTQAAGAARRGLCLYREEISTPLGIFLPESGGGEISRPLAETLLEVRGGSVSVAEDEDLPRRVRSALKDAYQPFGLRRLLDTRGKTYVLTCRFLVAPVDATSQRAHPPM